MTQRVLPNDPPERSPIEQRVDELEALLRQTTSPLHGPAVGILRRLAEVSMDSGAARHLLRAGVRLYRAAVDFLEAGPRGDGAAGG
jgi:hypothetical protein